VGACINSTHGQEETGQGVIVNEVEIKETPRDNHVARDGERKRPAAASWKKKVMKAEKIKIKWCLS
jgi:hypothetical protein